MQSVALFGDFLRYRHTTYKTKCHVIGLLHDTALLRYPSTVPLAEIVFSFPASADHDQCYTRTFV